MAYPVALPLDLISPAQETLFQKPNSQRWPGRARLQYRHCKVAHAFTRQLHRDYHKEKSSPAFHAPPMV